MDSNEIRHYFHHYASNGIVVSPTVFQQERALLRRERPRRCRTTFSPRLASDMTNNVLAGPYGAWWFTGPQVFVHLQSTSSFVPFLYLTILDSTKYNRAYYPEHAIDFGAPITLFFMIKGGLYIPHSKHERWHPVGPFDTFLLVTGYSAPYGQRVRRPRHLVRYRHSAVKIGNSILPTSRRRNLRQFGASKAWRVSWFNRLE
jgi:hypothetical protein